VSIRSRRASILLLLSITNLYTQLYSKRHRGSTVSALGTLRFADVKWQINASQPRKKLKFMHAYGRNQAIFIDTIRSK
ncbi:MAG: hypothetical protein ACLTAO_11810, partial [Christensenellales bacterium]